MKKLYIKQIKLDFSNAYSKTIDLKEIEQSLNDTYQNHTITPLNEMTTISEGNLIIAYSIVEKPEFNVRFI